jgi:uncharacterized protein (UPF0297 family)
MENANKATVNLELAGNRTVSFTDRGRAFGLVFRQIGDSDWKKFFACITAETERDGDTRIDRFDFRSAGMELVESCLVSAAGYKIDGQGTALESIPGWQKRIPYGHKVKAAELLQDVSLSTSQRDVFISDTEEVVLRAKWGSSTLGCMNEFDGLIHRFSQPEAGHLQKYNRSMSETRTSGGNGKPLRTVYPARQALFIQLYDELIDSVEGYALSGDPTIALNLDQIRNQMDAFHKVVALQKLFSPALQESLAG